MTRLRYGLCLFLIPVLTLSAFAQPRRDAIVIYKDGFYIKGIVHESVEKIIYDREAGRPFPIFSGNVFLNDHVRDILFSTSQINKVYQPKDVKPPIVVVRFDRYYQKREFQPTWEIADLGKWTDRGERTVQVRAGKMNIEMTQRIAMVSSQHIKAITNDYTWNPVYFTQEFGPELTRKILLQIFSERKALKALTDAERSVQIAAFLHEAGWFAEAERELATVVENFPTEKKTAEELLAKVKKDRADLFVENVKQAAKVGQHQIALAGLDAYDRLEYAKIVASELRRDAQDLRARYEKSKTELAELRGYLKSMPLHTKSPKIWTKATEFIAEELSIDTARRLEEFLASSQQFDLELKNKREHSQSAEKVLATAISGWLQESQAALPDPDAALKLARAREFVLEYLRTESATRRASLLSEFRRTNDLPVDVMARVVRMIPPAFAPTADKLGAEMQSMTIEVPDSEGGSYLLQLPPDYHPLRPYPVLLALHSGQEKAEDMHKRFAEEAAKAGFILAAPQWGSGKGFTRIRYQHSKREHDLVVDTVRDLRRRFQVDSDRVFLFGWEDGADMAFDVAMGHPDLFAGVAPMGGSLLPFTRRFYWPNVQYLPMYIIGGDRTGQAAQMRDLFKKEWNRSPYACTYVEYKGRVSEWFGLEVPKVLHWMQGKKRYYPIRELGRPSNGTGLGEEFRTSRPFENRFYWLRGDAFLPGTQNDHQSKIASTGYRPATFQAYLSVGNKSVGKDEAQIWNQVLLRVSGMKSVSLMISPDMMKLQHPVSINLNGQVVGGMRKIQPSLETMLEELYQTGDRQRLYVARIDLRL